MKTKIVGILLIVNAILITFLAVTLQNEINKNKCVCGLTNEKISLVCLSKFLYKLNNEN